MSRFAPTAFGSGHLASGLSEVQEAVLANTSTRIVMAPSVQAAPVVPFQLPANFPVALAAEDVQRIEQRVKAFDFSALAQREVVQIGAAAEAGLNRALDGFLGRVEQRDAPQLFKLVERLKDAVEQENLPDVAARILDAKPTLGERFMGMLSKKALAKAMDRAYEDACRIAAGKSKKLSDVIVSMESQLQGAMTKVDDELRQLDQVKNLYRESFRVFAEETAFANAALQKARVEAEQYLAGNQDAIVRAEIQDKLQALESRALALEATLTKLPADQLVIRQLQNAGVATLQELATTMASRFASIRMTLLTIHGARMVQDVQRLGQQGAALDQNLNQVRSVLMRDVVGTAAAAPGQNRMQQAKQLESIVADTQSLYALTEAARETNQKQFEESRDLMAKARSDMLTLGKNINPGASYAR